MASDKIDIGMKQITAPPEMIEGGMYFADGLNWYRENFLSPVGASLVYIVFALAYAAIGAFLMYFIPHMLPLKAKAVMVLEKNRPAGTFINLKPMRRYQEPSYNIIIALVENYITQRETYVLQPKQSPEEILRQKKKFMEATSSKEVAGAFNEWVSGYNSVTGDFLLSDIETKMTINSSELDMPKRSFLGKIASYFVPRQAPNSATVYFTSINSRGRERRFVAKIGFQFKLPKERGKGKMHFKVISHSVSRL